MYPRLSWSTLKKIEECPQQYLLHRQRKYNQVPERFTLVGNVLHYVSEQLILDVLWPEDIVQAAERDFDRRVAEARALGWNEAETAEARDKVTYGAWRMVELYEEEFGLGDKQEEREGQILSEMHLFKFYKGWCLEGYIDVAVQPDREVHTLPEKLEAVYDVKTGTSHEQGQLQFYDVLVEAYFGMRPKRLCWIEPLARGVVEVMVTPEENFAMKQRIKAAVESIQANEFPTSGFPKKCGWCSSSPFCPATERARNMKLV